MSLFRRPFARRLARASVGLGAAVLFLSACGGDTMSDVDTSAIPDTNSADVMFTQMMIPHHEQAIVMSDLAVTRAEDPAISALALQIAAEQQPEIDLMESWLAAWGMPGPQPGQDMQMHEGHGMSGMLSEYQLQQLADSSGKQFDRLFAEFMIEHHEGAIDMAQGVLSAGENLDVAAVARGIVVTQEQEILQLRTLLAEDGDVSDVVIGISPALSHVHGAVVDEGSLLVGTHDGLHRVDLSSGTSTRVGTSQDDLMAFAGEASGLLVSSGHPGPGSSLPNPLGFMTSRDGGVNWESVSLLGEVDFHSLAVRGEDIVGWDTQGPLRWSKDEGRTWVDGPMVLPTSVVWFSDRIWMATTDLGLVTWLPGEQGLKTLDVPTVFLAAASSGDALWRIDNDGSVHHTRDGEEWTDVGSVRSVEAFAAQSNQAFVVSGGSIQILELD